MYIKPMRLFSVDINPSHFVSWELRFPDQGGGLPAVPVAAGNQEEQEEALMTKLNTITPCAACRLLRRRCAEDCPFFPYFSPDEPLKFASVHKVFGASNVAKMLMVTICTTDEP